MVRASQSARYRVRPVTNEDRDDILTRLGAIHPNLNGLRRPSFTGTLCLVDNLLRPACPERSALDGHNVLERTGPDVGLSWKVSDGPATTSRMSPLSDVASFFRSAREPESGGLCLSAAGQPCTPTIPGMNRPAFRKAVRPHDAPSTAAGRRMLTTDSGIAHPGSYLQAAPDSRSSRAPRG